MNRAQISHDAWTYYEFGARSFHDDIRALILDQLDQTPDRDAISTELREQASAVPLPFIPISLERVTLESEPIDTHSVCRMPSLGLYVQLDQQDKAIAHLRHYPELMTKIRDRVARQIALDLCLGVFSGSYSDGAIPLPAPGGQFHIFSGEDREAVPQRTRQGIRFPDPPPTWAEAPLTFEQKKRPDQKP